MFAMFGAWLKLLPSSNRPTSRTLRLLSCPPRSLLVSVRVLHIFRIFCSRFISGSLVLLQHWRIFDDTAPFLGKGRQPVLVEARCGLVSRRARSGALLPEARSFDDKFDAVGAPSGERGRSAQTCRTSAEFASEDAERAAQEEAVEATYENLHAIAMACARTAGRLLFRRSGACMSKR